MEAYTHDTLWNTLTVEVREEINVVEVYWRRKAVKTMDNDYNTPWSSKGPLKPMRWAA